MMVSKKLIKGGFMLALVAAMFACVKAEDVYVKGLDNITMRGLSRVDLALEVVNQSKRNISITDAHFTFSDTCGDLAEVVLRDPVTIRKRSDGVVNVALQIRLTNPLSALTLPERLSGGDSGIYVSGEVKGRLSLGRKKIRFENMPVSQFLSTFAGDKTKPENLTEI